MDSHHKSQTTLLVENHVVSYSQSSILLSITTDVHLQGIAENKKSRKYANHSSNQVYSTDIMSQRQGSHIKSPFNHMQARH